MNGSLDVLALNNKPEEEVVVPESRFNLDYLQKYGSFLEENVGVFTRTNGKINIAEELYDTEDDLTKLQTHPWEWKENPVPYVFVKDPVKPHFRGFEKLDMVRDPMDVISGRDFGSLEYSEARKMLDTYVDKTEDWNQLIGKRVVDYDMAHLLNTEEVDGEEFIEDDTEDAGDQEMSLHGEVYRRENYGTTAQQRELALRAGRLAIESNKT